LKPLNFVLQMWLLSYLDDVYAILLMASSAKSSDLQLKN